MQFVDGGVTAPQGFTANGIRCGIKASRTQEDTALVFSSVPCAAAGVFTTNRVKAECVRLTMQNLADGKAQAAIANAGIANACTGTQGYDNARRMAQAAANALGIPAQDVIVCSTGVIGQQLPVEKIEAHAKELAAGLSRKNHERARVAIMTTDTHYKECAVQVAIGGKTVTIGAMCKGSGMIHINMGTMLCFVTTDCAISAQMLKAALEQSVAQTFNCVSVDGDTSTNDTLTVMANGLAGNVPITGPGKDFDDFLCALNALCTEMAKKIAGDGEGATHLLECVVTGASSVEGARILAKSVVSSSLVKAMVFGRDANFGRILCAMGYSGVEFSPEKTTIMLCSKAGSQRHGATDVIGENAGQEQGVTVYDHGVPLVFDEELAKRILGESEVTVRVMCEDGHADGTAWGCDLTYDYVKINGDYRT